MRRITLTVAALAAFALPAAAQREPITCGLEVRSYVGAYIPTGAQRDDFKAATTIGAQVADEISEHFHVLGSFGWTHGHNKFAGVSTDVTYVWNYDIGVELNDVHWIGDSWL